MHRAFAFGLVVGSLLPAAALAQDYARPSSGQQVLQGAAQKAPTPLPVTLDVATPDSEALARINANPTLAATSPVSAPAAQAFSAAVNSGVSTQLPNGYPSETVSASGNASVGANGVKPASADVTTGGPLERIGLVYNWRHNTGPFRDWLRLYEPTAFQAGVFSIEYGTQYWTSPIWSQSPRRTYLLPEIVRFGYQLSDPGVERRIERLKGNFEVMAEVDTIPIVGGPGKGTSMIGGSGLLRYNRIVNHRIVPYVQVGFGGLYDPAYQFANAPTDTPFNFITQIGTGSHLFLNDHWAIMMESSFVMINNFGIGRSPGYYVLGGLFGITRYFGGRERCDH